MEEKWKRLEEISAKVKEKEGISNMDLGTKDKEVRWEEEEKEVKKIMIKAEKRMMEKRTIEEKRPEKTEEKDKRKEGRRVKVKNILEADKEENKKMANEKKTKGKSRNKGQEKNKKDDRKEQGKGKEDRRCRQRQIGWQKCKKR